LSESGTAVVDCIGLNFLIRKNGKRRFLRDGWCAILIDQRIQKTLAEQEMRPKVCDCVELSAEERGLVLTRRSVTTVVVEPRDALMHQCEESHDINGFD
jgi:hypothetical protein